MSWSLGAHTKWQSAWTHQSTTRFQVLFFNVPQNASAFKILSGKLKIRKKNTFKSLKKKSMRYEYEDNEECWQKEKKKKEDDWKTFWFLGDVEVVGRTNTNGHHSHCYG